MRRETSVTPAAAVAAWTVALLTFSPGGAIASTSAVSELTLHNTEVVDLGTTIPAAGRLYVGPRSCSITNASALVLEGDALCTASRSQVDGRVVITRAFAAGSGSDCSFNHVYETLNDGGATALILADTWATPGAKVYYHYTMDTQFYRQSRHRTAVADVPLRQLLDAGVFDDGNGATDLTLTVDLSLTLKDNAFLETFRSWRWTLTMRVVLPLFSWFVAFAMAREAAEQRRRRLSSGRYSIFGSNPECQGCITEMVCTIEAPICALYGVWLAAGQYGPHTMPLQSHTLFFGAQIGWSLFTTVAMTFTMSTDKRRDPASMLQRKQRQKMILAVVFVIGPVLEAYLLILRAFANAANQERFAYIALLFAFVVVESIIVAVFIRQGCRFVIPIRQYLRRSSDALQGSAHVSLAVDDSGSASTASDESSTALLGRVTFWLVMSAFTMLGFIMGLFGLAAVLMMQMEGTWPFELVVASVATFRILINLTKVQSLSSSSNAVAKAVRRLVAAIRPVNDLCRFRQPGAALGDSVELSSYTLVPAGALSLPADPS